MVIVNDNLYSHRNGMLFTPGAIPRLGRNKKRLEVMVNPCFSFHHNGKFSSIGEDVFENKNRDIVTINLAAYDFPASVLADFMNMVWRRRKDRNFFLFLGKVYQAGLFRETVEAISGEKQCESNVDASLLLKDLAAYEEKMEWLENLRKRMTLH